MSNKKIINNKLINSKKNIVNHQVLKENIYQKFLCKSLNHKHNKMRKNILKIFINSLKPHSNIINLS